MEQRYQAVLAVVQDGWKVTEVAERLGVSRQSVHAWIARYEQGGLAALADRSHRPAALPAPDRARGRGADLRAAARAPRLGTAADRAPARPARRRSGALALEHLPVPEAPPADRAPAPSQAPRRVPPVGARASDAAVADGRDGRRRARRRHRAQARDRRGRPQPVLRRRGPRAAGDVQGRVRGAVGLARAATGSPTRS